MEITILIDPEAIRSVTLGLSAAAIAGAIAYFFRYL